MKFEPWYKKDEYDDYSYIYFDINKRYIALGIIGYMVGIDF